MSLSGVNSDIDDAPGAARPEPEPPSGAGRRWSIPAPPRLSLPVAGMLIYAGIRLVSVAIVAIVLGHGQYRLLGWSLVRWMRSSDGGHYRAIAEHGYTYPAGQLAHASVFSWFPGYPAVIDSIAWLPWITIVAAGLIVTAVAGMAAAWGLTTLGLKLTGDPRISLLMVAIWAVAPSSTVLSMLYAEALFCALAVWALVALVSRQWLAAGLLTLAAGTVRSTAVALILTIFAAAVLLMLWSLTERIPVYLHVYTIVVVILTLTTSANWISSKPRFLLPAVLLALPVARLLAPLRTSVLVPLIGVLAVATTWFGLYLAIIARW